MVGGENKSSGLVEDIDNNMDGQAEHSRATDRYRTLARLVRGYVFEGQLLSSTDIEFTWADDEFTNIFGCDRETLNTTGWQSFVDPRDRKQAEDRLLGLSQGKIVEIEIRIVSLTGQKRWLRMAAEIVLAAEMRTPIAVVGMAEDITSRKDLMEHMFQRMQHEQRRIGRDLHDGLGQVLTGVSLVLRSHHTRLLRGGVLEPAELEQLIDHVTGAIETTRSLAHGLAPGTKEIGGLWAALSALALQSRQFGLNVELLIPRADCPLLDATVSDHLYRIVQEAINNITRHAHSTLVVISCTIQGGMMRIEVRDDGIGIGRTAIPGFGLHSMQYRADAIGAAFNVEEIRPRGTCVRVDVTL